MKALGTLDRYVLKQWMATFLISALGIPAVATLIHLSDRLRVLTGRNVPTRDILLGELYYYPYQLSILLPAGILFATVFTLNGMGRRSELTAAKAGGISFLRLITPILILATLAMPLNFALQELAATSSTQQRVLHRDRPKASSQMRANATFHSFSGWTYGATDARKELEIKGERFAGRIYGVMIDSPDDQVPRTTLVADSALWSPTRQSWTLHNGFSTALADSSGRPGIIRFRSMEVPALNDPPSSLVDERKTAEEMRYDEFARYLDQLRRSATVPGQLKVDFYLKLALPVACLIVALFGAPLAVTNPRAGAALGLAMALGTTLVYLTGIQIMKAVGGKELISAPLAAWSMNLVFGLLALILLRRVRS